MANSLISLELMTSLLFQTIGIAQGIKVCKNPEIGGILFEAINDNLKYRVDDSKFPVDSTINGEF